MAKSKSTKAESPDKELSKKIGSEARKQLLARVAAPIAASIVAAPSENAASPEAIAEISVDVAEAILQRVGL